MVFALETYCAASDGESRRAHRGGGRRHRRRTGIITKFPAEELLVCGRQYVRGADLVADRTEV